VAATGAVVAGPVSGLAIRDVETHRGGSAFSATGVAAGRSTLLKNPVAGSAEAGGLMGATASTVAEAGEGRLLPTQIKASVTAMAPTNTSQTPGRIVWSSFG
jgi:hypothetical protein